MLSLQRPYVQIFQNLLFCIFWNCSIAAIFWQQIYGCMSMLMYRKLRSKVSKYCQFILQKPYVQRLDLMSKRWTYGPVTLFLWKTLSPYLGHKALVRTSLCPFMGCSLDIRLIIAALKALCPKYNFTKTLSPSQDLNPLISYKYTLSSSFRLLQRKNSSNFENNSNWQLERLPIEYNFISHKMSIISKLKKWT